MTLDVRFYRRPGCHLCAAARGAIETLRPEFPLRVEEIDVSLDPALEARYGSIIPVIEVAGRTLAAPFTELEVRRLLREVTGRSNRRGLWSRWI